MSIRFPSTKITNASSKVDKYLNIIYELKNEIEDKNVEIELLEDIEGWGTCLDEVELALETYMNTEKKNEYIIDKQNKEIIIY